MAHFLLIYDRAESRLLEERAYENGEEALAGRFDAEKKYQDFATVEIVVLNATTRDDLLVTHARYFLTLDELATRFD